MNAKDYFKGKKVTLMRIGLLGRGVGDAAFLARAGARVLVVDSAPQEAMQASVDALTGYPEITFKFGAYDLDDFRSCDLVLKGAGTPLTSPEIAEARAHHLPVRMSADLFVELSGLPSVGVTGTRGKSTTTHLLYEIFERAGRTPLLGGNIRGVSTLGLLEEVSGHETAVLELDSWQLQGFGAAGISPNIAVFTTFFPDHLNYYHGDMDAYLDDKAQIFLNQKEGDTLVLGSQVAGLVQEKYAGRIRGTVLVAGEEDLPEGWGLRLFGAHNRYNAGIAITTARSAGIEDAAIREAVEAYGGVSGRLEFVRSVGGIAFYNDTTATTPEATVAALQALHERHPGRIVLITGGADKALDMTAYVRAVRDCTKHVALLEGTGTERVLEDLHATVFTGLADAFEDARAHASSGDAVVLSPGFASFGMFRNEYDRGDQFNALVSALPETA
ncbi:MAG TPA: UDP-N-acetylmuramoyl-L-alanine--D-glutamate ligase [Candidatus Paceibacterota bacterium]|jgi:UDP-N-acetylmuramoylalanine--D-glutamate ligase